MILSGLRAAAAILVRPPTVMAMSPVHDSRRNGGTLATGGHIAGKACDRNPMRTGHGPAAGRQGMKHVSVLAAVAALCITTSPAPAQTSAGYPSRAITMVVPQP